MGGFAMSHRSLAVISRQVEHSIALNAHSLNSAALSMR